MTPLDMIGSIGGAASITKCGRTGKVWLDFCGILPIVWAYQCFRISYSRILHLKIKT